MKLHYLQHVDVENLAQIEPWARNRGATITQTRLFEHESLPKIDDFDWLVVMGGPMNIYEEDKFPWLRDEKRFIHDVLHANRVVIGICLGAQLIADVLSATVTRNPHTEIGWFDLQLTDAAKSSRIFADFPPKIPAFHWHGDTFALPEGALHIASSEACENQIFQYGDRVIGLQCHLEESESSIEHLLNAFAHEMTPGPFVQRADEIRAQYAELVPMNAHLTRMLDRLADAVK